MAFENVNVSSLRASLINCKNSLNYNSSSTLIEIISNNNVWNVSAKSVLKEALITLTGERYKDIEKKISDYESATNLIEEYQILEADNKRMESEYRSLEPRLYYEESYEVSSTDADGNVTSETEYRTVMDYAVKRMMDSLKQNIEKNKERMKQILIEVEILI